MMVNWGCGSIQPEDWINIDNDPEFASPFRNLKSFIEIDVIVAHCSLQMVEFNKIEEQLKEFYDHLKSGGILRISLPDLSKGFYAFSQGNIDWFPNGEENLDDRFSAWLTWYSTSKTLLTIGALKNKLVAAGFTEFAYCQFNQSAFGGPGVTELDTRLGEVYFIEARK